MTNCSVTLTLMTICSVCASAPLTGLQVSHCKSEAAIKVQRGSTAQLDLVRLINNTQAAVQAMGTSTALGTSPLREASLAQGLQALMLCPKARPKPAGTHERCLTGMSRCEVRGQHGPINPANGVSTAAAIKVSCGLPCLTSLSDLYI